MSAAVRAVAALLLACLPAVVHAAAGSVEIVSDERRRGLSWSDGQAAGRAALSLQPHTAIRLDGALTTLRGSRRHRGSDAVLDIGAAVQDRSGPIRLDAGISAHIFAGGTGPLDYAEVQAGVGSTIGPADLDLSASYAPRQKAIGGELLYVAAGARVALVGTPLTIVGGVGRSSGDIRDPVHAARLRPTGSYVDWRLGLEHSRGVLTAGLFYVGNDIAHHSTAARFNGRGNGDTLLLRLGLFL